MTKIELTGSLNCLLHNFVMGLVGIEIITEAQWKALENKQAGFQAPDGSILNIDLTSLATTLASPKDRKIAIDEFQIGLKRALVSEGHEIILAYCEETNQFALYKAEPWFQFARIIRNVVSHKDAGILRTWPKDLIKANTTSVRWRSRVLNQTDVGKQVDFTYHEALQLFKDQSEFALSKLT